MALTICLTGAPVYHLQTEDDQTIFPIEGTVFRIPSYALTLIGADASRSISRRGLGPGILSFAIE
jgi:hypothetical protein